MQMLLPRGSFQVLHGIGINTLNDILMVMTGHGDCRIADAERLCLEPRDKRNYVLPEVKMTQRLGT